MSAKRIKGLTVEIKGSQVKLTKALKDAQSDLKSFQRSISSINRSIKLDPDNVDLYTQKQKILEQSLEENKKTLEELLTYKKQLDDSIKNQSVEGLDETNEEYQQMIKNIAECHDNEKRYQKELEELPTLIKKAENGWDDYSKKVDAVVSDMDSIISSLDAVSKAFQFLTATSFKSSIDYESDIASIKKVITDLSDGTIQELKNIAVETGNAFENVSSVATLGGTLGIAENDISSFTKTLIDLNTATDGAISFDEGSKSVARFLNVMGIGTDKTSNFGSALVYVGDQFAATADEILEVSSRMAGLSTIAGVNQYDLIGLAAEMKNLGLSSESSASAMTRVFMTINNAVASGGETLEKYAKVAGMSASDFANAWKNDAMNAFLTFTDGIDTSIISEISEAIDNNTSKVDEFANAMGMSREAFIDMFNNNQSEMLSLYADSMADLSDESQSASEILADLGLTNVRTAESLLKLAGNGDVVKTAIEDANIAWDENTALTNKANTVYETVESRWKAIIEKAKQFAASFSEDILPAIEEFLDWGIDTLDTLENMNPVVKTLIASFVGVGAAAVPIAKTVKSVATLDKSIRTVAYSADTTLQKTIGTLTTTLGGTNGLLGILGTTMPWALGIAGVALMGYAAYVGSGAKATAELNKKLNELDESASENLVANIKNINSEIETLYSLSKDISENESLLTFDSNGKVDKTAEAYSNLQTALDELNNTLGSENGTMYYIDETTGKIVDQQGEVANLTSDIENLRDTKLKEAWMDANDDKYIEYLQLQEEEFDKLAEKEKYLASLRENLYGNKGYQDYEIEWYNKVASGIIDVNSLADIQTEKFNQMKEAFGGAGSAYNTTLDEMAEILKKYQEYSDFTELYESIQGLPWDEAKAKLEEYDKAQQEANARQTEETKTKTQAIKEEIAALEEDYAALDAAAEKTGDDVTGKKEAIVEQINSLKQELLDANQTSLENYNLMWDTFAENYPGYYESIIGPIRDAVEGEGGVLDQFNSTEEGYNAIWNSIKEQYPEIYNALYKPYSDAIDAINAKEITDKTAKYTITVETIEKIGSRQYINQLSDDMWGNGGSRGSGGYFGDVLSKIPTGRIDALASSISKTIDNARQAQSKLASGGYTNQIALNASFNINNNGSQVTQNLAKQMAKQVVDYVNEELGKAM